MKIIRDNKIYVQRSDISMVSIDENLKDNDTVNKILNMGYSYDDKNKYDFVLFTDEDIIEFLRGLDYIVDYDEVKDMSDEDLEGIAKETADERNNVTVRYARLDEENMRKEFKKARNEISLLEYKLISLRDLSLFKNGHLKISLPEGIEYPKKRRRTLLQRFTNK